MADQIAKSEKEYLDALLIEETIAKYREEIEKNIRSRKAVEKECRSNKRLQYIEKKMKRPLDRENEKRKNAIEDSTAKYPDENEHNSRS
ncbi:hypothetical protein K2173_024904 [Erythroxylum novogranatense]|uniref:Uncharacterized protein n=1 Tax=Erythroxylum novogranatense TaxID=1862640 RepID=A0AAV8UDY5_9ROSI|nr:hypothetical protein K2173_024904 [Erythroxylum novogranatense]